METRPKTIYVLLSFIFVTALFSCKKEWLEAKPNKQLVVPASAADYQALLNNTALMNTSLAALGTLSDDNYYLSATAYKALTTQERNAYTWADTEGFYSGNASSDWLNGYNRILRTNIVLDGLEQLSSTENQQSINAVKGTAMFFRSLYYFGMAQVYCQPFSKETGNAPGLPLRTSANVNLVLPRATVQQTYELIVNDALVASRLLPPTVAFTTSPSKTAAYGLLARVFLSMEDYDRAFLYSDSCLQLKSSLLDYSKLSTTSANPFLRFNDEVIFHTTLANFLAFRTSNLIVDPLLYQSYVSDDLRKSLFFIGVSGSISFKGSYDGSLLFFGGLATDEQYLIRSECNARKGRMQEALQDLNLLLKSRWRKDASGKSTYADKIGLDEETTLRTVLNERRKQLCFRGLRWTDLRRLNRDEKFKKTITREIDGTTFTLLPGSARYVLPIEDKEILQGGIEQNIR
jgi:hypothetical protein